MPSVVNACSLIESVAACKEQGESSRTASDCGNGEEAPKVEIITNDAVLKCPVTPGPASEPGSIPALRRQSLNTIGQDKADVDNKGKPVVNLCRIPRSLLKAPKEKKTSTALILGQATEVDEMKKVAASIKQQGVLTVQKKSSRNSVVLSEFAKQVRLRVKKVKRHMKVNVYQRRVRKAFCLKSLAAKELLVKAGEERICADVVFDEPVLIGTRSCGRAVSTPTARELCHPYRKVVDEYKGNGTSSVCPTGDTPQEQQPLLANVPQTSILASLKESSERECTDAESGHASVVNGSLGCTKPLKLAASANCLPSETSDVEHTMDVSRGSTLVAKEILTNAEQICGDVGADKCGIEAAQPCGKAGSIPKTRELCVDEPALDVIRSLGHAVNAAKMHEHTENDGTDTPNSVFLEKNDRKISKESGDQWGSDCVPCETRVESDRDPDIFFCEYSEREMRQYSATGRRPPITGSLPMYVPSGHPVSQSSNLDMIGQTRSYEQAPKRGGKLYRLQAGDRSCNVDESTERSEYCGLLSGRRHEVERVSNREPLKCFSTCSPVRGAHLKGQDPTGICGAKGNVWGMEKRAEQGEEVEDDSHVPLKAREIEQRGVAFERRGCQQPQGSVGAELPAQGLVPYSHFVELNWKYPVFDGTSDLPCSPMVRLKERSVFVGCIPDGVPNLEQVLQSLMDKFLERFDFAPASLGLIQLVKIVKDIAFIELASDKVAQIVLAANQLDLFEWGINAYHFNIQGCTQTTTSVRPAVEYLPLRPARVIYVGNIPMSRWRREYLEAFFSRMLQGCDGPSGIKYVVSVYLLPDSSDAYVELATELMADAVIFKCTKDPEILRDIGDEVLLCRDANSIPLMSRHRVIICPQRTLFVGVTPRSELFKIDTVVKLFLERLPFIAREREQPGYLEYVGIQPGKEYAFFQFSSEAFVDAIMDEYIENTQILLCRAAFIVLRLPEYVRPGARYQLGTCETGPPRTKKFKVPHILDTNRAPQQGARAEKGGHLSYAPRRFGDEPVKKPDSIVSLGASPPPLLTWNGLPFGGGRVSDPDCMVIVEGLPKGLNYKLVRGALNELFERLLCDSGLLEAGTLVVRYLARYGHFEFVASLPNAEFVCALLSIQKTFVVAGGEVSLQPLEHGSFEGKSSPAHFVGNFPLEPFSLSDEDSQGKRGIKSGTADRWRPPRPKQSQQRKRGHSEMEDEYPPGFNTIIRAPICNRRNTMHDARNEWDKNESSHAAGYSNEGLRGPPQEPSQQWMGDDDQQPAGWYRHIRSEMYGPRSMDELPCQGNRPRVRVSQGSMGTSSMSGRKWNLPSAGQGGSGPTMGFSPRMTDGGGQYH